MYFLDERDEEWSEYKAEEEASSKDYAFVSSFDAVTGTLEVFSKDFETFSDFTVRAKIVATDLKSSMTEGSTEAIFQITLKDHCLDSEFIFGVISGKMGTEAEPNDWDVYQVQEISFPPVKINFPDCPVIYRVLDANEERSELALIYDITTENDDGTEADLVKISGVWTESPLSTTHINLMAYVGNFGRSKVVTSTQTKYWLKVTDPCLRLDIITPQLINDLDYWIGDPTVASDFLAFTDVPSLKYASTYGADICGPKEYQIVASDSSVIDAAQLLQSQTFSDYLSLEEGDQVEGLSLRVETSDPAFYTNAFETFYVRIVLVNYLEQSPESATYF